MNSGKVCVSVCAETADALIAKIKRAEEFADVIEVRFDCLPPVEIDASIAAISSTRPLIATFRSPDHGGVREIVADERLSFWQKDLSKFWAVDLEEDIVSTTQTSAKRIASFHKFGKVVVDIEKIYSRLAATDAEIIKIAVATNDVVDAIQVWKLLTAASTGKDIIPIAMGEAGKWTRILGLAHGAFLTYASLDTGSETADGQITAKDLVELYRVKELTKDTRVFGVIGDPLTNSMSPYMHNPAFAEKNIDAVFIPLQVKNLDAFITRMVKSETREVELNFAGFSVTMPHKQAIIKHLDAIDPTAEKIRAVNTVKIDDGKLTGYNTDAHGFITPLKKQFGDLRNARVGVFGAGGAARACVFALKEAGAEVTIFARDRGKAELLANELTTGLAGINEVANELFQLDIIVDATPLGMKGPLANESLFSADQLSGVKFVYDLVTSAADTPIVAEAKKAGVPAIGGIEMLIEQGLRQFEIWTGQSAPADVVRNSLLARLNS